MAFQSRPGVRRRRVPGRGEGAQRAIARECVVDDWLRIGHAELDTGRNPVRVLVGRKVLERLEAAAEFMLAGLDERVGSTS